MWLWHIHTKGKDDSGFESEYPGLVVLSQIQEEYMPAAAAEDFPAALLRREAVI